MMLPLGLRNPRGLRTKLRKKARKLGVKIETNCGVQSVAKDADGFLLQLSNGQSQRCEGLLLATGGCRKPGTNPLGLAHAIDVLCETKPRGLADVRGILLAEAVASGDGPDERCEPVDQRRPGPRVAPRGVPHEVRRHTRIRVAFGR